MPNNTIVAYCERIQTAFEPINTISNLGFAVPTLLGILLLHYRYANNEHQPASDRPQRRGLLYILVLLPLCIGLGSATFHFNPSRLTQALDIIPIASFVLLASWIILEQTESALRLRCTLLAGWIIASVFASLKPDFLAGSLFYLPTLVLLLTLGFLLHSRRRQLLMISAVFSLALLMRTLDLLLCISWPYGTHVFWHLLNSVVCLMVISTVVNHADTAKPL